MFFGIVVGLQEKLAVRANSDGELPFVSVVPFLIITMSKKLAGLESLRKQRLEVRSAGKAREMTGAAKRGFVLGLETTGRGLKRRQTKSLEREGRRGLEREGAGGLSEAMKEESRVMGVEAM